VGKWEILGIINEGVNNKPRILYNIGIFMVKMSMKHGVCLSGLLGTHNLSLKRLVVFMDIHFMFLVHSMIDRIMLLFGVTCVIPLTITLVHILIMHAMLILIHPYL